MILTTKSGSHAPGCPQVHLVLIGRCGVGGDMPSPVGRLLPDTACVPHRHFKAHWTAQSLREKSLFIVLKVAVYVPYSWMMKAAKMFQLRARIHHHNTLQRKVSLNDWKLDCIVHTNFTVVSHHLWTHIVPRTDVHCHITMKFHFSSCIQLCPQT